jgi:arylsulfatase A-like enzyme
LYREVLHVPLIVAGPGIPAGVRVPDVARTRQIFETVLDWAGVKGDEVRRSSLARVSADGRLPDLADEPAVSELLDNTPPPYPGGLISLTTEEWHFIYRPGVKRNRLYHWPTDPIEEQNRADAPENQALVEQLSARLLSTIRGSYRPWRDTGYLEAVTSNDFSPDREALRLTPSSPGSPLLPPRVGAAQALFPPNPEPKEENPDRELLESLPYNAR